MSTHCRTMLMSALVTLTMLNTRMTADQQALQPVGRISSIRILLYIEDAIPRTVMMTELRMA